MRRRLGITQAGVVRHPGVTQGRVSAIEHAKPGTTELRNRPNVKRSHIRSADSVRHRVTTLATGLARHLSAWGRSAHLGRQPGPARVAQLPSTRRALLPLTAAAARV